MTGPFRVLMVFLDGVGIGGRDPRRNPFFSARLPALTGLLGGWLPSAGSPRSSRAGVTVVPVNATLGVAPCGVRVVQRLRFSPVRLFQSHTAPSLSAARSSWPLGVNWAAVATAR